MAVRHVRDSGYWGAPVGTPIVAGMRARAKMAGGPSGGSGSNTQGGGVAARASGSNTLGTLARTATPATPNRRGTAAARMAAQPKGGGAWSAMAANAAKPKTSAVVQSINDFHRAARANREAGLPEGSHLASGGRLRPAETTLEGRDYRTFTPAEKVRAAEMMHGTGGTPKPRKAPDRSTAALPRGSKLTPETLAGLSSDELHAGMSRYSAKSQTGNLLRDESFRRSHDAILRGGGGPRGGPSTARAKMTAEQRAAVKAHRAETTLDRQGPVLAGGTWDTPGGSNVAAAEVDIRAAVERLQGGQNRWIGIADLRDELGQRHDRATVDQVLKGFARVDSGMRIIPVANTKALKPRDHDAAVNIGGEDNHAIQVHPDAYGAPRPAAARPYDIRETIAGLPSGPTGAAAAPKPKTARAKMTRAKAPKLGPVQTAALVNAASTRQEAETHLQGLTVAELKAVAAEMGVTLRGRSKTQIVDDLAGTASIRAIFDRTGSSAFSQSMGVGDTSNYRNRRL